MWMQLKKNQGSEREKSTGQKTKFFQQVNLKEKEMKETYKRVLGDISTHHNVGTL